MMQVFQASVRFRTGERRVLREKGDQVTGRRGPNASSLRTKATILQAALDTLRDEGIADTSARAIARAGNFNQALIFYHFGSVDDAILTAFEGLLDSQRARYEKRLSHVTSFDGFRTTVAELVADDLATGVTTTIAQGFAGATHRPYMRPRLLAATKAWLTVIEELCVKLGSPAEAAQRRATTFLSLYLGYEIYSGLRRPESADPADRPVVDPADISKDLGMFDAAHVS